MSYRVAKNTTKRTQNQCLKCPHCEIVRTFGAVKNYIVKCLAPNKVISGEFNAFYLYCIEYKGINEMSDREIEKLIKTQQEKESFREYKKEVKKYFTKEEAKKKTELRKMRSSIN